MSELQVSASVGSASDKVRVGSCLCLAPCVPCRVVDVNGAHIGSPHHLPVYAAVSPLPSPALESRTDSSASVRDRFGSTAPSHHRHALLRGKARLVRGVCDWPATPATPHGARRRRPRRLAESARRREDHTWLGGAGRGYARLSVAGGGGGGVGGGAGQLFGMECGEKSATVGLSLHQWSTPRTLVLNVAKDGG